MSISKRLLALAALVDEASEGAMTLGDKASDLLDVASDALTYLAEALDSPPAGEKDIDAFLSLLGVDLNDSQKAIVKAIFDRVKIDRAGRSSWSNIADEVWPKDGPVVYATNSVGVTTAHKGKPVGSSWLDEYNVWKNKSNQ